MTSWLQNLDISVLKWINQTATNPAFDQFFPFITDLNKLPLFLILACGLLVFFFYKKYQRQGLSYFFFLLLSLATSDFIGAKIKHSVDRQRPFTEEELGITQRSPANPNKSFYSNHSSNSFAFATYTSTFFPAAKYFLFTFSALVAYSRVYNGVHYPSDVLAGSIMGMLIGFLVSLLAKKIFASLQKIQKSPSIIHDENTDHRS